uniref:Uncharacterized protein n=1 Tax=Micrurus lemniscatus lemniscatus TaxID=129467 RepID=A0A2D4HWK0_MICLE
MAPEATFTPMLDGIRLVRAQEPEFLVNMQAMLNEAVRQGVSAVLRQTRGSPSEVSASSSRHNRRHRSHYDDDLSLHTESGEYNPAENFHSITSDGGQLLDRNYSDDKRASMRLTKALSLACSNLPSFDLSFLRPKRPQGMA